jgi:hypothetical protein
VLKGHESTYSIGDTIFEPNELDSGRIFGPFGEKSGDQLNGRIMRVGWIIRKIYICNIVCHDYGCCEAVRIWDFGGCEFGKDRKKCGEMVFLVVLSTSTEGKVQSSQCKKRPKLRNKKTWNNKGTTLVYSTFSTIIRGLERNGRVRHSSPK